MEVWSEAITERKSGKITDLFWWDLLQSQGQESELVSVEHCIVEYGQSRAAGYPKMGWWTNSSHAEHRRLLIKGWILLSSLLSACAYWTILNRKYVLNKHVRLLTRLYSILHSAYYCLLKSIKWTWAELFEMNKDRARVGFCRWQQVLIVLWCLRS